MSDTHEPHGQGRRPDPGAIAPLGDPRPFLRCRLCWRVTVFVFLSILVVELAILVPSYLRLRQNLLDQLESKGLAVLSASIHGQLASGSGIPIFDFGDAEMIRPLVGLRLYSSAGNLLGSFGEAPRIGLEQLDALDGNRLWRSRNGRYLVLWTEDDLKSPMTAIASIDSSGIGAELTGFVWRILGLTVIVSLFVGGATMAVLMVTVLRPVLLLRRQMLQARQDPRRADQHVLDHRGRHELGEMIDSFNALVRQLATRYRSELDASEQRFQDFARSASDWYWEMDEELRFSYFSERFEAVTGVPPEKLLGKTRQETGIPDVDLEAWQQHLADLAAHRPFRSFIHPRRKADGELVWLSVNGQPYYDGEGRFRGYRGTGANVTRLKQVEDDLRVSRDRAEVANRAKSEFLANMSHEIRTPMTAVIGMAELLLESPLSDRQRDKVETIIGSGEGLLVIINDILDLSRLEAGKLEIRPRDIGLHSLLHGVVELMADKARAKGLELSIDLPEGLPERVHADGARIRQVLINLVGNAIKFTERGGVRIRASLGTRTAGLVGLRFSVEDSGSGISQDDLQRLFEKFEQGDSATNRHYGGSGLGLAISKQLVELMDGEIGADSALGQGSTFWFTLPLREARSGLSEPAAPQARHFGAARALKILLAEDNAVNQTLFSSLLGGLGHELTLAHNGREAVEAAGEQSYDVILMDVRMPVVDGLEATRLIRQAEGPNQTAPIIAVTADAMVDNEQEFLDSGMDAIATKPIRLAQLLEAIDGALGEPVHSAADAEIADSGAARPGAAEASAADHGDARTLLDRLQDLDRKLG